MNKSKVGPKILALDIETAPMEVYIWGLGKQFVSENQINKDWSILCWAAKWLDKPNSNLMSQSLKGAKNPRNDLPILRRIYNLINSADILVTQNGKSFDLKKLNARFIIHGFKPVMKVRHIDTLVINRKHFGFTSNKLGYLSKTLNLNYKKLEQKEFVGLESWKECLKGNRRAWREMELYNKYDVLALEALYKKVYPWDSGINFNVYNSKNHICACGSKEVINFGYRYTNTGKYQRHKCKNCGAEFKGQKV